MKGRSLAMGDMIVLGRTGLKVSRLGLGGIPIQRVDERQAVETVAHAIRRGIDFIDTSRLYTTSERRIGMALRETGGKVILATKSPQRSADGIRRDVEVSLRELGRDRIDIYQCHFVNEPEEYRRVTSADGALAGLLKARDEGLIGNIGITGHNLNVLGQVIADGLFETIMTCFSFLEPKSAETVIPKALAANVGVILMKPFSGGVIGNARLALKYALAVEGTVVIPGMEKREIVDENVEIFLGERALAEEEIREIGAIRSRFDRQFCRRCDYCQPCPEKIPIQYILGIRFMVKRMGPEILAGGWVRDGVEAARRCTGCGACLKRCPYSLPVPDLIRKNVVWADEQIRSL